jgi:hypothetical protein
MDGMYYKKCSRCHRMKEVLDFFKDSGDETKTCEECREVCRNYQRNKKSTTNIKDQLNEIIKLATDLRDGL